MSRPTHEQFVTGPFSHSAHPELTLREFEAADWPSVWQILQPVFRAGETYPYSPNISEAEARKYWIDMPSATYVAVHDSDDRHNGSHDDSHDIVGTYYIKPNQPTLGAHVCNCGYVVSAQARDMGIASRMCKHSQREAARLGFLAMQFNLYQFAA